MKRVLKSSFLLSFIHLTQIQIFCLFTISGHISQACPTKGYLGIDYNSANRKINFIIKSLIMHKVINFLCVSIWVTW